MKPSVYVVMSTYNAHFYLEEQVRSIMNQEYVDVKLYVRDDGSTNQVTKDILLSLRDEYPDRIIVSFEKNVGVGNSFMKGLYASSCDFDYYAFADQDDVWLPDKLFQGVQKICDQNTLALYCSNQIVTDAELQNHRVRFSVRPEIKFGTIMRGNKVSGCTFIMNKSLRDYLVDIRNRPSEQLLRVRIHDVWVVEVAALFGVVYYDDNGYIMYRQHGGNVVGAMEYSITERLRIRFKNLISTSDSGPILARECLKLWKGKLGNNEKYIEAYASYKTSFKQKRILLNSREQYKRQDESMLMFLTKVLVNKL